VKFCLIGYLAISLVQASTSSATALRQAQDDGEQTSSDTGQIN